MFFFIPMPFNVSKTFIFKSLKLIYKGGHWPKFCSFYVLIVSLVNSLLFQRMLTNSYWDPKFVSRAPALKREGQEQTRAGMREERKPAKKTMERSLPRKWFYKML